MLVSIYPSFYAINQINQKRWPWNPVFVFLLHVWTLSWMSTVVILFKGALFQKYFKLVQMEKISFPLRPIPLLSICPEKTIIEKNTCTPMFTATLFTIAKTWKKPRWNLGRWYWWTYLQGSSGNAEIEKRLGGQSGGKRGWNELKE